jgi:tetratricopeptide (TPR) repeat protein
MANKSTNIEAPDMVEANEREGRGGFLANYRLLAMIGVGLLVIVGGIWYYNYSRIEKNDQAQIELARIRPYYDRGEYATAITGDPSKLIAGEKIKGLAALVSDWKSTPSGKIAALYLGDSYMATGKVQQAEEPFEIAAEADAPLVSSAAHAGLAAVAEATGQYEKAAEEYEKAASEDRVELNTPDYLVAAARNYERAGKKDEAIKNYRAVATRFSDSQANAQARLALARYNVEL